MVLILSLKLRRVREIPLEKDYSFFDEEQKEEEEKLSREFFSFFFASLSLFCLCSCFSLAAAKLLHFFSFSSLSSFSKPHRSSLIKRKDNKSFTFCPLSCVYNTTHTLD